MTEKNYGGDDGRSHGGTTSVKTVSHKILEKREMKKEKTEKSIFDKEELDKLKKAGEIVKQAKAFARQIVKKDVLLFEIAEKIEAKIFELGGRPAFPVNLSINEIAAHSTPSYNDEAKAHGLLKVDIGAHVDGYVADSAFSIDLDNTEENKKLIESAEAALKSAVEKFGVDVELREIGREIEAKAVAYGFRPVNNLSGHSIEQYDLHSGWNIPNFDNSQTHKLQEGVYAIEPFVTSGAGKIRDGKFSGIYSLQNDGQVRDSFAREVLAFIDENYLTLPFCTRWLVKKFGTRALIAMKRIEEAGLVHQYFQLVEIEKKPVAQAEHTIILVGKEKIVTT
jgi:methionyl aminopeptidase